MHYFEVKVWYPATDKGGIPFAFPHQVEAKDIERACAVAFRDFNEDGHCRQINVRSMSVGDLIQFPRQDRWFVVEPVGFSEVSPSWARRYMAETSFEDRLSGSKRAAKSAGLPPPRGGRPSEVIRRA